MSHKENSNKYNNFIDKTAHSIANWYLMFLGSIILSPIAIIFILIMLVKHIKEYKINKKKYNEINVDTNVVT